MKEKNFPELIPDPEALLDLEPEELAGTLLEILNSLDPRSSLMNRYNFSLSSNQNICGYPQEYREKIGQAIMGAWAWLEREGMIFNRPGDKDEWIFITRRGQQMQSAVDLAAYRKINSLPRQQLHPKIVHKVWATFLRGDYDTAVFQSFKEVEVAVRKAAGFSGLDLGVDLMRKAFHVDKGPLTDRSTHKAERQALSDLFAGSIGSYKNPHSHREVQIEAEEAVEMIILASHLLKIVDNRVKKVEGSE